MNYPCDMVCVRAFIPDAKLCPSGQCHVFETGGGKSEIDRRLGRMEGRREAINHFKRAASDVQFADGVVFNEALFRQLVEALVGGMETENCRDAASVVLSTPSRSAL